MTLDLTKSRDAVEELLGLFGTLSADVKHALDEAIHTAEQGKEDDSHRARRNVARAVFADVEGTVYGMKQTAYELDQGLELKVFNQAEVALLREEEYRMEDNGKARVRSARLRTEPNLRFAFDAFARVFGSSVKVSLEGEDLDTFRRAVTIRDRLTHPKKADELTVSVAELEDLVRVEGWFFVACEAVLRDVMKRLSAAGGGADSQRR